MNTSSMGSSTSMGSSGEYSPVKDLQKENAPNVLALTPGSPGCSSIVRRVVDSVVTEVFCADPKEFTETYRRCEELYLRAVSLSSRRAMIGSLKSQEIINHYHESDARNVEMLTNGKETVRHTHAISRMMVGFNVWQGIMQRWVVEAGRVAQDHMDKSKTILASMTKGYTVKEQSNDGLEESIYSKAFNDADNQRLSREIENLAKLYTLLRITQRLHQSLKSSPHEAAFVETFKNIQLNAIAEEVKSIDPNILENIDHAPSTTDLATARFRSLLIRNFSTIYRNISELLEEMTRESQAKSTTEKPKSVEHYTKEFERIGLGNKLNVMKELVGKTYFLQIKIDIDSEIASLLITEKSRLILDREIDWQSLRVKLSLADNDFRLAVDQSIRTIRNRYLDLDTIRKSTESALQALKISGSPLSERSADNPSMREKA